MSEKYYVVSEENLRWLCQAAFFDGCRPEYAAAKSIANLEQSEAACRARPVRLIGLHGEGSSLMLWGEEV